ncbi:MAG: MFS transporter [Pseudomonadota bacterium]
MSDASLDPTKETPRFLRALRALRDRRMAAMLLLSLAAGLPYGAVLGTLNAWLTQGGVTPSTIGVLSIMTLGYSFKYLWAPAFQAPKSPPMLTLGPRRSWLLVFQVPMAVLLVVLALSDPIANIGIVALIALLVALMSATHDIILDAWRIEVARSEEDKDLMAAIYQFGYRSSIFITGFVALLLAARIGWVAVYCLIGAMMLLAVSGTLIAPEPDHPEDEDGGRQSFLPSLPEGLRERVVQAATLSWAIAGLMIAVFVIRTFTSEDPPSARDFVRNQGPIIVGLTVILPALVSVVLLRRPGVTATTLDVEAIPKRGYPRAMVSLFRAIFDPLMELINRLRWGALLVLLLALTYRFTDAVWGAFAYPFYLGENYGALSHTLDDVAIASKFFGVLMTISGAAIGAAVIAFIGRMPVLVIGAILAAVTNLLFADLAAGGAAMDAFLRFTQLGPPLVVFAEWAAVISPEAVAADQGQRMARLMMAIAGENLAGGFASVAIVAFLTGVVNPRFAAVQYALLGSLTMLIGTLGRPWLGELIETDGFYTVFIVTFWLGGVAVLLSLFEWYRQAREKRAEHAGAEVPDAAE